MLFPLRENIGTGSQDFQTLSRLPSICHKAVEGGGKGNSDAEM